MQTPETTAQEVAVGQIWEDQVGAFKGYRGGKGRLEVTAIGPGNVEVVSLATGRPNWLGIGRFGTGYKLLFNSRREMDEAEEALVETGEEEELEVEREGSGDDDDEIAPPPPP